METIDIPPMINGEITFRDIPICSLPRLPRDVKILHIENTTIQKISEGDLPEDLEELYCINNSELTSIKGLPTGLKGLILCACPLQLIPLTLPSTLHILHIANTELTNLPELPDTIHILLCCGNKDITKLPDRLPSRLSMIWIHSYPNLLSLPDELPENIIRLCMGSEFPWQLQNESTPEYYQRIRTWISIRKGLREKIPQSVWIVESRKRTVKRCKAVKEELMAATWHTDRVLDWCDPNAFSWED